MAASAMLHSLAAGLLCHVVTAAPAWKSPDTQHRLAAAALLDDTTTPLSVPIIHATDLERRKLQGRFLHITGKDHST